jgi:hypothetical protein
MKGHDMNPQIHAAEERLVATHVETTVTETESLTLYGFTPEEIATLLWLRRWYQTGGSDRAALLRHWKFLKHLIITGKLEL